MSRILLVSSEKGTLSILTNLLKTEGYKVVATQDPQKAKDMISSEDFNLMIASVNVDADLDLITLARAKQPAMPVVAITKTGGGDVAGAVVKLKPFACIEKPLKVDQLLATVQKAVDFNDAALTENVNLNLQLETCYQFEQIVAESPAMRSVCDMLNRVAPTDITVLISGETGTGKEAIARTLHLHSRRKDKPFTVVDCAKAAADSTMFAVGGTLEASNGGTVFLRHVETLPLGLQERLLKTLQDRKLPGTDNAVDVRVVASVTGNPDQALGKGAFSSGLYKFLKVIVIKVPPLRERKDDIMPTVRMALRRIVGENKALPSLDQKVVKALEAYSWPQNSDTVEAVLSSALKKSQDGRIMLECLPPDIQGVK
jgi:DNA-binding NtrC family response regulator